MKKILSIVAIMGLASTAMAQTIKVGPELGATYNTMTQKVGGFNKETNYQIGFRVGGVADFNFNESFSIQPGLFLSMNNGTESYIERNYKTGAGVPTREQDRRNYSVTYVQLPIYALYKTGKEFDDPHFFFGIGPSFNYAIGGRFEQEYTNSLNGKPITKRYDYSIPLGNDRTKDKLRPFDIAVNVTAGYETNFGIYFRAHYSIGLLNAAPAGDSDNCFRNSGFGLSIGYLFKASNNNHWD